MAMRMAVIGASIRAAVRAIGCGTHSATSTSAHVAQPCTSSTTLALSPTQSTLAINEFGSSAASSHAMRVIHFV